MNTKIKLLNDKAVIPTQAHDADSGYDLTFIGVDKIVGDTIFFKTGIAIAPPRGFYWEIVPCSRLSKYGLSLANSIGVIDEDYRGEVLVALRVHHSYAGDGISKNQQFASGIIDFEGKRYRNLATLADDIVEKKPVLTQLVFRKRYKSEFLAVEELPDTERGEGGFGSTEQAVTSEPKKKEILSDSGE